MGFSTKVQVSHRRVRGMEGGCSVFDQPGWNLASDESRRRMVNTPASGRIYRLNCHMSAKGVTAMCRGLCCRSFPAFDAILSGLRADHAEIRIASASEPLYYTILYHDRQAL